MPILGEPVVDVNRDQDELEHVAPAEVALQDIARSPEFRARSILSAG
ncbi:MAG: hypothetical protein QM711_11875 [Micropruina sp.]